MKAFIRPTKKKSAKKIRISKKASGTSRRRRRAGKDRGMAGVLQMNALHQMASRMSD